MPPEPAARAVAQEWLQFATSNLALSRKPKPAGALWSHLCFNAQQAAEQAVKAVLVLHGIDFPRSHAIGELLDLLDRAGHAVPDGLMSADDLSDYAVTSRYPGVTEPVSEEDHRRAVELAEQVVRWAEAIIRGA